jgi:polysaccharide biosynthesis transport protein
MDKNYQLITPTVDLLAPTDRFVSSSRLHGRVVRYRHLLRKFWWVILLILVSLLGPTYLFTAGLPPAYTSKAKMWLTGRLNINENRLYTEELIDYLATQIELLRSVTIQHRALVRLRGQFSNDIASPPAFDTKPGMRMAQKLKGFVKGLIGLDTVTTNAPEESIPFSLKVTESSKSSTLELQAKGTDPAATRAFLDCLMEEYFAFKKETRDKAFNRTLASVSGEARSLANELKSQQEKLHSFQSTNNVVFLQEQGNSAASYLSQLNRQISDLFTQLQLIERLDPEQWIDVQSRGGLGTNSSALAEAAASETLGGLAGPQAKLFEARQAMELLKAQQAHLTPFLRPAHPKMIKLAQDIAAQQKLIDISREEAFRQLRNRRQTLQLQITNLEAAFQLWDRKALAASRKIADYDNMKLDLQRLQAADDRMLGVIQNVDVSKTVDQENVGVLEAASPARQVPSMAINMSVAFVGALVLSFVVLYCLGMFDDRFASFAEVSGFFSEEVLAQIPAISLKKPKGEMGIQFLERQKFEFLESFRNLRSSLLYMSNGEKRPKTILITSSVPKEGKSTVALYLAATLAIGNSRVLLIDGDMRRSSLHKFFGARSSPGLAEILSREVAPARAILPSSIETLSLLPAGLARRNPGELVLSPELGRFMTEISPRFDYILIDSPPLMATDDSASLAPQADGVLMVVRGAFTSARTARRALTLLRQRRAHVLGLVLNRAPSAKDEYHHYQHFEKAYRWHGETAGPALVSDSASGGRGRRAA